VKTAGAKVIFLAFFLAVICGGGSAVLQGFFDIFGVQRDGNLW
jgi:hypothetical protein